MSDKAWGKVTGLFVLNAANVLSGLVLTFTWKGGRVVNKAVDKDS